MTDELNLSRPFMDALMTLAEARIKAVAPLYRRMMLLENQDDSDAYDAARATYEALEKAYEAGEDQILRLAERL